MIVLKEKIKKNVREGYGKIAKQNSSCCGPSASCCGDTVVHDLSKSNSEHIGYTKDELKSLPEGADLGLGCGNPVALASLKEGETVLDLGSGAGIDCFLAANRVGDNGRVIGVDMTHEMLEKARKNGREQNFENVEFRLGEIENLPVADNSVDVIISNCVINLSPEKGKVFREAFRVLKPGGRLMVSDIVLTKELPEVIASSIEAYIGCVSGAIHKEEYTGLMKETGFSEVKIVNETTFPAKMIESLINDSIAGEIIKESGITVEKAKDIAGSIVSINITGMK